MVTTTQIIVIIIVTWVLFVAVGIWLIGLIVEITLVILDTVKKFFR